MLLVGFQALAVQWRAARAQQTSSSDLGRPLYTMCRFIQVG